MKSPLKPAILTADNFTPPTRTPWGGTRIVARHKAGLARYDGCVVGEAWEFSLDAAFPSRIAGPEDMPFLCALTDDPAGWLGTSDGEVSLLFKMIDAADRLSLQVHPHDDYPGLTAELCGKPEAWYIVAREPGAGIWLGFADGVTKADVEAALDGDAPLEPLLNFVPVEPGDAFVIAPGTVHAIGAGVTLVEPQLVKRARSGVTYRFWDWGRRYAADGRPDPAGAPRALHRAHAIAVTDWRGARGQAFVDGCRRLPRVVTDTAALRVEHLLALGPVDVERVVGRRDFRLETRGALTVAYALEGALTLDDGRAVGRGTTVVVPASTRAVDLAFEGETTLIVMRDNGRGW